jgi:hypothetical protein
MKKLSPIVVLSVVGVAAVFVALKYFKRAHGVSINAGDHVLLTVAFTPPLSELTRAAVERDMRAALAQQSITLDGIKPGLVPGQSIIEATMTKSMPAIPFSTLNQMGNAGGGSFRLISYGIKKS